MKLFIRTETGSIPNERNICVLILEDFKKGSNFQDCRLFVRDGRGRTTSIFQLKIFFLANLSFRQDRASAAYSMSIDFLRLDRRMLNESGEINKLCVITMFPGVEEYFILIDFFKKKFLNILSTINDFSYLINLKPDRIQKILPENSQLRKVVLRRGFSYLWRSEFAKVLDYYSSKQIRTTFSGELVVPVRNAGTEPNEYRMRLRSEGLVTSLISAVIGKNGVGKTRLLGHISAASHEKLLFKNLVFVNAKPPARLSRQHDVIRISVKAKEISHISGLFSRLFDEGLKKYFFDRIKIMDIFLKDIIPSSELQFFFEGSQGWTGWSEIVKDVRIVSGPRLRQTYATRVLNNAGDKVILSQGQIYIIEMFLSLLLNVGHESLVLIDEPELFLHPNYVVTLIEKLQFLMSMTASVGVVSTHSVFVVRELPKESVFILTGSEGSVNMRNSKRETLGASLDRLSSEIFFEEDVETRFEHALKDGKFKGITGNLPADILARMLSYD